MQLTLFDPQTANSLRYQIFLQTELGQLYQSLPIKALASLLPGKEHNLGTPGWFTAEGKIALQFLKPYLGLSDEKLLERLNTDWALQLFCGIQLKAGEWIKDKDLLWRTRAFVAAHLQIQPAQELLVEHWRPWMGQSHFGTTDATCYESYIKYPTDVQLLWDCCEWVHRQIKQVCSLQHLRRPRSKIKEQRSQQLAYSKKKRKTKKEEKRRRRALLYLLSKLIGQLLELLVVHRSAVEGKLGKDFEQRLAVVLKVQEQQQLHYDQPKLSIKDRIVSLFKPYLRPIVRGKENKRVEFGAKAHIWQVDGINFIEHLSFDAFHEGNRLPQAIAFHNKRFETLRQLGADQIYATNANRKLCTKLGIATCFKPKGRPVQDKTLRKQQQQLRKAIGTTRATVLEGSFGNEKNHYGLAKIPARSQATEILWIFFAIHTANAKRIANRRANSPPQQARAA